ncbi:transglutaminase-like domain-containing protein [Paenibacillus nasutitermitis]|uniref:Transglutaminase-like domain-containing protein n=1 Tax=Paenibacillus nasutitermitis TaxID=1652958 RepID=A0A916YWR4_9BACL|nr:transglutaminase-like domain-containing protein [Paenibacillus nasutitermitis]GGD64578.1 hypothetical protein GCM10010911_22950 [Paenibacillus nasutitermitis]
MRSFFLLLTTVCLLALPFSTAAAATGTADTSAWLDLTQVEDGIVGSSYKAADKSTIMLLIAKSGTTYTYKLKASGKTEYFPLQLGDGSYSISLMEGVGGGKYKKIGTAAIDLKLSDASRVFLGSVQNVDWKSATAAVAKAKEITKNKKTDDDKIKAIHDYIVKTISYDSKLSTTVSADYIPDAGRTLKSGKGICYDYSSLFAVMARSVGIPTKLVMGTSDYVKGYHAWNQVLNNGKWVIIDSTIDASLGKNVGDTIVKASGKYTATKLY